MCVTGLECNVSSENYSLQNDFGHLFQPFVWFVIEMFLSLSNSLRSDLWLRFCSSLLWFVIEIFERARKIYLSVLHCPHDILNPHHPHNSHHPHLDQDHPHHPHQLWSSCWKVHNSHHHHHHHHHQPHPHHHPAVEKGKGGLYLLLPCCIADLKIAIIIIISIINIIIIIIITLILIKIQLLKRAREDSIYSCLAASLISRLRTDGYSIFKHSIIQRYAFYIYPKHVNFWQDGYSIFKHSIIIQISCFFLMLGTQFRRNIRTTLSKTYSIFSHSIIIHKIFKYLFDFHNHT